MKSPAALEVIEYLKEHLTVEIEKDGGDYYERTSIVRVAISLDGEEITSSSIHIKEDK